MYLLMLFFRCDLKYRGDRSLTGTVNAQLAEMTEAEIRSLQLGAKQLIEAGYTEIERRARHNF